MAMRLYDHRRTVDKIKPKAHDYHRYNRKSMHRTPFVFDADPPTPKEGLSASMFFRRVPKKVVPAE